ncbi:MAG: aminopeptidase P family protein [Burkholderiales bacterium]|nr:aminopeptidase P family protein [Burkholderiales bacterium]
MPQDEYDLRLRGLQARLAAAGMDGVILNNSANFAYYTGFRTSILGANLVWTGLVVPASGEPHAVVCQPMSNLFLESSWVKRVQPFGGSDYWGLPSDPVALVRDAVLAACGKSARIGLERSLGMRIELTREEIHRLDEELRGFTCVDASALLWQQRIRKTPWEQDLYRELGRITAIGFRAGMAIAQAGVSEREIQRATWNSFIAAGADDSPVGGQLMVRSGRERNLTYCGRATGRRLAEGDQLMLAGGPGLAGYHIDIHRFACIGAAPDLQRSLFAQSEAGLAAAIEVARPGVLVRDVYRAAHAAMTKTSATAVVPWKIFGHGLGLDNYEPPMIGAEVDDTLAEGMVLTLEVPAYDIPEGRVMGAFQEESVLLTGTGCEVLTAGVSRDLHVTE